MRCQYNEHFVALTDANLKQGVDLIMLFGTNLLVHFSKLDLFIAIKHTLIIFIIWPSLQKVRVNWRQNSFKRLTQAFYISAASLSFPYIDKVSWR
jgi:hypothetical protein